MEAKVAFAVLQASLLVCALFLALGVPSVAASSTIYIRSDGSIDPSTAPIFTTDNVTYTFVGSINDSIVVERDDIVIDGAGYSVQGVRADNGIDLTGRTNVTVRNAQIRNFYWGISLSSCSRCTISENNITANVYDGISLYYSNGNNINGNRITENQYGYNIQLYNSSNNNIDGNDMTNNYYGIGLRYSSSNTISRNNVTENIYTGIELFWSSNNIVSGNKVVTGSPHGIVEPVGILLGKSSHNNISGNSVTNGYYGICLLTSFDNNISGNSITESSGCGIILDSSLNMSLSGNDIHGNDLADNYYGIQLYYSSNNTISENTFIDDGLVVSGSSYMNTVEDNAINGKPLVYLEGVADYSVNGDVGQVVLVNCTNIWVENLTISSASIGVQLLQTNNSVVSGNIITANRNCGIELDSSFGNNVSKNNVRDNNLGIVLVGSFLNRVSGNNITTNYLGVYLYFYSKNNSISGNHITKNNVGVFLDSSRGNSIGGNNIAAGNQSGLAPMGIYLGDASVDNSISGNNVTDTYEGIRLDRSGGNNISENNLANNVYGVDVGSSSHVSISRNNITNNHEGIVLGLRSYGTVSENNIKNNLRGIVLGGSYSEIYHNNFINNTRQVISDLPGYTEHWDNGCEGNYWSDYNGTDANGDGIGDTPYVIDAYNQDKYPLMNPYWNPADINHDLKVDMEDLAIAAESYGSFTGYAGWNPHADITGPPGANGPPDGKVDIRDVAFIAKNLGRTQP